MDVAKVKITNLVGFISVGERSVDLDMEVISSPYAHLEDEVGSCHLLGVEIIQV